MGKELDRVPDYTVFPGEGDSVPGLKALQSITEQGVLSTYRQQVKSVYQPFIDILSGIDSRLTNATSKADQAIAALGDGVDPGEIAAYVDAEIEKISALVSKNAADIAQVTVNAVQQSVEAVTNGINEVAQGAAGAVSTVADAFAGAFSRMVNALTGKALGKWHQEIYLSAMTVTDGTNDIPLGVTAPFDGKIGRIRLRTDSFEARDPEVPASAGVEIWVNQAKKWSAVWNDGTTDKTWDIAVQLYAGNVIRVKFVDVTADIQGVSVTLSGDYL